MKMGYADMMSLAVAEAIEARRAVAWLRVAFAAVAVLVIQLNPERAARFPALSTFSLISFLVYSLVVLVLAWRNKLTAGPLGILTTSLDVVWIAVIVFSTGGTRTPFFFYYSFTSKGIGCIRNNSKKIRWYW